MRSIILALLWLLPAAAPAAGCITVKVWSEMRETVTDSRGKKSARLTPAQTIGAGEELFYTVSATNTCEQPVANVRVDVPVPQHMVYVPGSAIGPAATVLFSTDGGFNFAPADELHMPVPGGAQRPARPNDYTHIRWVLRKPVQPQAVVFARFRAVVK